MAKSKHISLAYYYYITVIVNVFLSFFSFSSAQGDCGPSGTFKCRGKIFQTFDCSPSITNQTPARMSNNNFERGGDGGSPSECDGNFHPNSDNLVALSTGWYASGSRCGNMIRITASNGQSVLAKVTDECDSRVGCDKEHSGKPPCGNNIIDASNAVWDALGLNKNEGVVDITWSLI